MFEAILASAIPMLFVLTNTLVYFVGRKDGYSKAKREEQDLNVRGWREVGTQAWWARNLN